MDRIRRDVSLVLPFAVLGFAGGWLTTSSTVVGMHGAESPLALLLLVFTPISCAFLGEHLRNRIGRRFVVRTLLGTILAGLLNGLLVGIFLGAGAGAIVGVICGFFFALPFVPATLLIAGAARRVGRAAHGSLVDAADRRGVWTATLGAIAVGTLLPLAAGATLAKLAFGTVVALAILLFLDGEAFVRLGRLALLQARMQKREHASAPVVSAGATTLDLGVGDQVFEEIERSAQPYREPDRVLRVLVGDVALARRALTAALRRDALALGVALVALTLELTTRL